MFTAIVVKQKALFHTLKFSTAILVLLIREENS
jgi:hypothetical protein